MRTHRPHRHWLGAWPPLLCCVAMAAYGVACDQQESRGTAATKRKTIIIGFDGMDPRLVIRMMDAGELPHLDGMRRDGGFAPLATSIPPQSPVAWSSFITGAGPGVHGIFDFVHRNPHKQCEPFYSAAETVQSEDGWEVGEHRLPLSFWPFDHNPTQTLLQRKGTPFWSYLDAAGVPTRIYDIPADYPPEPSSHGHHCCLAGMGVPDMLGTYGTYQHFAEDTPLTREEAGGMRSPVEFVQDVARATLTGPANSALKTPLPIHVPFTICRDLAARAVLIEVQDQQVLLAEHQWSDWTRIDFTQQMPSFLPDVHLSGICRFYLQEVAPNFRLYVTPINIDPSKPAARISEPPQFVEGIAEKLGMFYTTGFQEDHKARSNGIFTDQEYADQADTVLQERLNLLQYALDEFTEGLLFFYFSSTDLQAHIFWWDSDEAHPSRPAAAAQQNHQLIKELYKRFDQVVGQVRERAGPDATLMVMSDHGFANFRRQFNLNSWLRENGYLHPPTCGSLFEGCDWSRTRAYGLGLNGLYLNLRGRERDGIVTSGAEREALLGELISRLEAVRDDDGQPVIKKVYRSDQVYDGAQMEFAPDLILGYHRGYRASWATTLGEITSSVLSDNDSAWSADHCIAADEVPGVLFSSRPIVAGQPSLIDLAPTILAEYGIVAPAEMTGRNLFMSPPAEPRP